MKHFTLLAFLVLTVACSKEEPTTSPIRVSFTQADFSYNESDGVGYIELKLSQPATHNFTVVLQVEEITNGANLISYPTASGGQIVDGEEVTLTFQDGATTGKFMFAFKDDNVQEDDQLLRINLISPQTPLYKQLFGNAIIDSDNNETILRIVSDEKLPKGTATMKVNDVAYSALSIKTHKAGLMGCDMYYVTLIFTECSPTFCETSLIIAFQSLPSIGTELEFAPYPPTELTPTQVETIYHKWGEWCYTNKGSISVIEHDPVAKKAKFNFSGSFWSYDGYKKRSYEITNGIIDLSLYDFSVCIN